MGRFCKAFFTFHYAKANGGNMSKEYARIRVAAFTGSPTISSRRFRVLQYVEYLAKDGILVDEFIARFGSWPPVNSAVRPLWFAGSLVDHFFSALKSHNYHLTFFQRELISTLLTWEPLTRRPRVLDVDDAVWLNNSRAHKNFSKLASLCNGVICGNQFIADQVKEWNSQVIVLPTAVDSKRFHPIVRAPSSQQIIGWSGLYAGSKYLLGIELALYQILSKRKDVVLRVVSDKRPKFKLLKESMVEFIPWSPECEVRTIQEMTLGLMPIDDTQWSRGKCSYKMLLYMACGVPVVVSPYGMNKEVLDQAPIGWGAQTTEEWIERIEHILDHTSEAKDMGRAGRTLIEERYSLSIVAPKLSKYLRNMSCGKEEG